MNFFTMICAIRALYSQWLVIFSPQGSPLLVPRTQHEMLNLTQNFAVEREHRCAGRAANLTYGRSQQPSHI